MKAVAYYRVSTAAQGRSGLGIEAQKAAVADLARQPEMTMLAEFTEVEGGKRNDRPVLAQALRHARITNAILVIAKLDRLSRNAAFLLTLRDSGVRFLAADEPAANDLTIGVLAVIAQAEREAISRRTKDALAAIKQKTDRGEVHLSVRTGRTVHRLVNPKREQALGERAGDLSVARAARRGERGNELEWGTLTAIVRPSSNPPCLMPPLSLVTLAAASPLAEKAGRHACTAIARTRVRSRITETLPRPPRPAPSRASDIEGRAGALDRELALATGW